MAIWVKFKDKEIRNPILKILVMALIIIGCILIVPFSFVMLLPIILGLIALAFILTVPLHFILRFCGRRGFYVQEGNSHTWTSNGAFRRR